MSPQSPRRMRRTSSTTMRWQTRGRQPTRSSNCPSPGVAGGSSLPWHHVQHPASTVGLLLDAEPVVSWLAGQVRRAAHQGEELIRGAVDGVPSTQPRPRRLHVAGFRSDSCGGDGPDPRGPLGSAAQASRDPNVVRGPARRRTCGTPGAAEAVVRADARNGAVSSPASGSSQQTSRHGARDGGAASVHGKAQPTAFGACLPLGLGAGR